MLLLGAVLLLPVQGTDVGKLVPVELVYVHTEGELIKIATDQGETGAGATVADAIDNLKETTAGIVFLDTADYVLIDEAAKEELVVLKSHLKPTARVCVLNEDLDLKQVSEFLRVHKPRLKLGDSDQDSNLETLSSENGRFILNKD